MWYNVSCMQRALSHNLMYTLETILKFLLFTPILLEFYVSCGDIGCS